MTDVLVDNGHHVVVYDNLQRGHRDAVRSEAAFVEADLQDKEKVVSTLKAERIEAVIHMAGDALVGESMKNPGKYYRTNVIAGLTLLEAMEQSEVRVIVFSSTCAVYGVPDHVPIEENAPTRPANPYGESKLTFERALGWYHAAHAFRVASLRYFNAAGASERFGERHEPETHLIPLVLDVGAGKRGQVTIFGDDYPTRDGTCVRDYIHVLDLADAHILALKFLEQGEPRNVFYNLGCGGHGHSNREVVQCAEQITGKKIAVRMGPRRPGDPPTLVASSEKVTKELGWTPKRKKLETMMESAWRWMQSG
jgi:UDP-glucose 4-epimerase